MAFGQVFRCLSLLTSLLLPMVLGQSDGYFVTPPTPGGNADYSQDKIYNVGDQVKVQWYTDFDAISLVLWQQNSSDQAPNTNLLYNFKADTKDVNSYIWTVALEYSDVTFNTVPSSQSPGNVFFFGIYKGTSNSLSFNSHYFNISQTTTTTTTTTATSSTTTSGTTTSTPSTTQSVNPAITTSSAPTPVPDNSGLSTGAQAGIGVGVGLVGLLAIAGFTWFFVNWRKRNRPSAPGSAPMELNGGGQAPSEKQGYPQQGYPPHYTPLQQSQPPYGEAYKPSQPAELTGHMHMRAELPPDGNPGDTRMELP